VGRGFFGTLRGIVCGIFITPCCCGKIYCKRPHVYSSACIYSFITMAQTSVNINTDMWNRKSKYRVFI